MVIVVVITLLVIGIAVAIHYQALYSLSHRIRPFPTRPRTRIVIGVLGALAAHSVEIVVFGLGYFLLSQWGSFGTLEGDFEGTFSDCVYFSFVTYTSLGFGDIVPAGHIRITTGLVTLTGLVLIAWTASFLFTRMQQYWGREL